MLGLSFTPNVYLSEIIAGALIGLCIGAVIGLGEALLTRNFVQTAKACLFSGLLGMAGGGMGLPIAEGLFQLAGGQFWGRALGWGLFGLLIGIVNYTGISQVLANSVTPLASNPLGLLLLSFIVAIPVLSPILGPGAAIAQVVGVLMGTQIGAGALPVQYALPTLFAIDGQVGCDFIPVGLSLGEAKPETVSVGVSAVLFTRMVTSPIAVAIAYLASFLL